MIRVGIGISPARFIRMYILEMSQTKLAKCLDVSQPTVSKMEKIGASVPEHHRSVMRELARKQGREIEDGWFEQVPVTRAAKRAAK